MLLTKEDLAEAKHLLAELMAASGIRYISYYDIKPSGQISQPAVSEVHCVLRNVINFGWDVCELTRTEIPPVIDKDSDELWESVLQSVISCWFAKLDPALPKHRAILRVLSHRYKDIIGKNATRLDTAQLVHRLRELMRDAEWQSITAIDVGG